MSACPKCGSGNIVVGAFPLSCQDCGWHYLNKNPCSVCGGPSRSSAGLGIAVVYGCDEHPISEQNIADPALARFVRAITTPIACLLIAVFVGGCSVGYRPGPDGTPDYADPIIGISTGTANAAGAGLLSLGGLLSGNPAVVGLAALVANQMGKRAGWDEREQAASVQAPLPTEKRT